MTLFARAIVEFIVAQHFLVCGRQAGDCHQTGAARHSAASSMHCRKVGTVERDRAGM